MLADLGLPAARLATVVRASIEGLKAASYKRGDRTYDIRVKLAEESGKDQIRQFLLPGADGRPIPLETVADVVDTQSKIQIYRVDKQRTVKILGDIKPGATMSAVGSSIAQTIADEKLLPVGYTLGRTGMSERMDEALADFREALVLAAFLTLLTLAAIMESWTDRAGFCWRCHGPDRRGVGAHAQPFRHHHPRAAGHVDADWRGGERRYSHSG